MFDYGCWLAGCEEESDVSSEVFREEMRAGLARGLGGGSKGFGHDFGLAEEDTVRVSCDHM